MAEIAASVASRIVAVVDVDTEVEVVAARVWRRVLLLVLLVLLMLVIGGLPGRTDGCGHGRLCRDDAAADRTSGGGGTTFARRRLVGALNPCDLNRRPHSGVKCVYAFAAQVSMTQRLIALLATTAIQTATIAGASGCFTTTPAPSAPTTSAPSPQESPAHPRAAPDAGEVAAVRVPGLDVTALVAIAREQVDEELPRRTLSPTWSSSLAGRVFAYEDLDDFMQGEGRCRPATLVPDRNDAGGAVLHSKSEEDSADGCTSFDELVIGADGTTFATDGFTRCPRGEVMSSGGGRALPYVLVEATRARLLLATSVSARVTRCERGPREVPCPGGGRTTCEDDTIVVDVHVLNANSFDGVGAGAVPPPHDCVAQCAPSACSEAVAAVAVDDGVYYDPEQPVLALFRDRTACRTFAAARRALQAHDE